MGATTDGPRASARLVTATWAVLLLVTAGLCVLMLNDRLTHAGLFGVLPPLTNQGGPSPRLALPLGYWNAVGLWCVVAYTLAVGAAAHLPGAVVRRVAGAAVPIALATAYLTYSRGSILTAAAGVAVALWLAPRRREMLLAIMATAPAAGVAVLAVSQDSGVAFATRAAQPLTFTLLLLACWGGGQLLAFLERPVTGRMLARAGARLRATPLARLSRRRLLLIGGALLVVVVGLKAPSLVHQFKEPYRPVTDVRERYGDLSSGGRIELWRAAWDSWRAHPGGTGPDTFRFTFDKVAPATFTARDAHSVYLERLAERGTGGLLLFLAAMAVAAALLEASRRAARGDGAVGAEGAAAGGAAVVRGGLVAASAGGLTAIMVGSAFDWSWDIPAVRALAFGLLAAGLVPLAVAGRGAAAGSDAAADGAAEAADGSTKSAPRGRAWTATASLLPVAGLAIAAVQFLPSPGAAAIARSQAAVRAGDLPRAASAARDAINNAHHPTVGLRQLGLVQERAGGYREAAQSFRDAIRSSPRDWRLQALLARVLAEAGEPSPAIAAMNAGYTDRPTGQYFTRWIAPPLPYPSPRPCTGTAPLELEHCERLPRADGTWELPGDGPQPDQPALPAKTLLELQNGQAARNPQERRRMDELLRLLDARPTRG